VGGGGLLRGWPGRGGRRGLGGAERVGAEQRAADHRTGAEDGVTGAERTLPPDVDQAAYRIVQEALTNVSRHAGQACASVLLRYTPDTLTVQVDDDGHGDGIRPAAPGLGLIGMRERVSALGGHLHAGPQDGGGFQVRAELPVRASS
jgi:signal transduction histidine kinase